ncbi:protein KRI1 homolog [Tubulanus polymorphus]|uniref:protein KRI1 homolog n=1 Tax=Tubulanus polymorphus TaxID=672921 RepID=UPI003DA4F8C5
MTDLGLDNSSDESDSGFHVNKNYAERYNKWRRGEELQKFKDKYGEEALDDGEISSSSSESEDDDAEALTPDIEKAWMKAYAAVKTKDPKIYSKEVTFFNEKFNSENDVKGKKSNKQKPMYLKDYERKVILERGGVIDEDAEVRNNQQFGYYEEQEHLKKNLKAVVDSDSDSDDELFVKKEKSKVEQDEEDADYEEWSKTHIIEDSENKAGIDLGNLKDYWSNPNLGDGEKFLRDYIMNKRYLDEGDERIPTYDEIVADEDISGDEEALEKQEDFERKFNFRFEEPDPEFIKSYPRTIDDSLRRKDDRRVKKRQEVKDRKEKEKLKKREELKQLKNMKRKEITDKLEALKEITGNADVGFNMDDLEGDFDPEAYDKKMQEVFNEGYYEEGADDEKPVFTDYDNDDEYTENWDEWTGETNDVGGYEDENYEETAHADDPNFIMDCDYDPEQDVARGGKKKRKRSKFAQALAKQKPQFNPEEKNFEEYFDEYYKLEYEDMIGDIPCRFKYRQVVPNDFGLTTEEVLKCKDKELNSWVSVKKASQYRTEQEEMFDKRTYSKKGRNQQKKLNILTTLKDELEGKTKPLVNLPSTSEAHSNHTVGSPSKKQKKRKSIEIEDQAPIASTSKQDLNVVEDSSKKRKKLQEDKNVTESELSSSGQTAELKKKKNKAKKSEKASIANEHSLDKSNIKKGKKHKKKESKMPLLSDERLKAYGINPKKFKYMEIKQHDELLKSKNKKAT